MSSTAARAIAEVGVPIIAIVLLGAVMAGTKAFPTQQALPWLNKFVFYVAIPATVFKGLATQDFVRDKTFDWGFIGVFLMLRVFVGIISLLFSLFFGVIYPGTGEFTKEHKRDWIGQFLTYWIAETYINTLIFGIPVLKSIYGANALLWNVLASISSLFFQLPVMLVFFEYRKKSVEHRQAAATKSVEAPHDGRPIMSAEDQGTTAADAGLAVAQQANGKSSNTVIESAGEENLGTLFMEGLTWGEKAVLVLKLGAKGILTNPPMWGIILGILYSLIFTSTTNGAVYTIDACTGKHFYPIHFDIAVGWLGDTVTPIASFCIGLFAYTQWRSILRHWKRETVFIILKMIVVPMFTIPLCLMFNVQPAAKARGAILIAAMPIALASFTLTQQYHVGMDTMASQVIIGTILMTPACVAWDAVMQSLGLFGTDTMRIAG